MYRATRISRRYVALALEQGIAVLILGIGDLEVRTDLNETVAVQQSAGHAA
jgi:hypothetical protein